MVAIILALLASPTARAAQTSSIEGSVRDAYGAPADVCVRVGDPDEAGYVWTRTAEDGSYSLDAPEGPHVVTAEDFPCAPGTLRFPEEYEDATAVAVAGSGTRTDFTMRFNTGGSAYGDVCCVVAAAAPGGKLYPWMYASARTAGRVRAVFDDPAGSRSVELTPSWYNGPRFTGFETVYPVPSDRPEGAYYTTLRLLDSDTGTPVADPLVYQYRVDGTPPTIGSISPGDGATIAPGAMRPAFTGRDPGIFSAGIADFASTATVYEITSEGTRVRLGSHVRGFDEAPRVSSTEGAWRARQTYDLQAGSFEIDWRIRDHAANAVTFTTTFATIA